MISKNKIKYITSLQNKKFRQKYNKFIIEGYKTVLDVIDSEYHVSEIYTSNIDKYKLSINKSDFELVEIAEEEMKKISFFKTASDILAIVDFKNKDNSIINNKGITLCLADIQDPGNLGTIIRSANWFGIENIVCSQNTVDLFNPKTLQATMGAFANTNIIYADLEKYLSKTKLKVYGTFLDGENIYESNLDKNCIVIMGNEGKGIPDNIAKLVSDKITIPNFAGNKLKAESLNVSTSTAIILSEFKRR